MVIGPLAGAVPLSALQMLLRTPEGAPLSLAEEGLAMKLHMLQQGLVDPQQEPPLRPQDDTAPQPACLTEELTPTPTDIATVPAPRAQPALAPALPPAEPTPPSATLLALAREPGTLPRQWQLEISAQPHAAPVVLQAQRQAAEPGWALHVQVAQAGPLHQDRLAARLARGGVLVGALQVSTDAAPRGLNTHSHGEDDELHDDRR